MITSDSAGSSRPAACRVVAMGQIKVPTRRSFSAVALAGALTAFSPAREALAQARAGDRSRDRRPLPDFNFTDAGGETKSLADFPGGAFVLNFWATWCPPCVEEMPSLDRLHASLVQDGIHVLPLSIDRGGVAQVRPFYQNHRLRHVAMWTDSRSLAARALGVHGLPTTVVTDRVGYEVARVEGPLEWDLPSVVTEIRRLGGPVPARIPG